MAFDGIAISCLVHELNEALCPGRIDKVYQPEQDEVILSIRSHSGNHKLLLTANASCPRLHLTSRQKDNPMQPPLFCMVMRKHLQGGKILSITQPDFERVVQIKVEALNEMGDLSVKTLTIEIMGKHSNIILSDENDIIVDSVKRVSFDKSSVRQVLPGKRYAAAPSQNKLNPLTLERTAFDNVLNQNENAKLSNALYQSYTGISPTTANEIIHRAETTGTFVGEVSDAEKENVYEAFAALMTEVRNAQYMRELVFDAQSKPIEFAPFVLTMYEQYSKRPFETFSELLEFFYGERDTTVRMSQKSQDLRKLVQLNIERCAKKDDVFAKTLQEIEGRDTWRLYGELLTAHLYQIQPNAESVTLLNYYEEDAPEITIPLQPNRTASENMQAYFKRYNKEKRTFAALQPQIAANKEELAYLESVLSAIQSCTEENDVDDIREELVEQGFLRRRKTNGKTKQKPHKSKPMLFMSSDGFEMYVGKNNKQNDELTLHFADANDLWLHTKDIPGSHVIVRTQGQTLPEQTINEAANLAVYFSKARNSTLVPVDYTARRHVKKPNGAKPGMVIYATNQTAYITPDMTLINNFLNGLQEV